MQIFAIINSYQITQRCMVAAANAAGAATIFAIASYGFRIHSPAKERRNAV